MSLLCSDSCDILLNEAVPIKKNTVSVGDNVVFTCTCLNDTLEWTLDGENITNDAQHIINATSGTLTLLAVRDSDSGDYTCSTSSENITLTVTGNNDNLLLCSILSTFIY